MKKYLYIILPCLLLASCVKFDLLPDNKTVDEDFWKTKSDVALMVNGAYAQMLQSDIIRDCIIWSDLRSGEVIHNPAINRTGALYEDELEITTANLKSDNTYTNWGPFYSVINNCNIVIEKAEGVVGEKYSEGDPNYTTGDYLADCAQMKALRALCYFYLVRNFRDVPYYTFAYMKNTLEMNLPQSTPAEVLQGCISDLEGCVNDAYESDAFSDWRRCGYFNKDAINALLADMYLWRASMTHNSADYTKCVEYCTKVIDSKNSKHVYKRGETPDPTNLYPALSTYENVFSEVFIQQNAEESIFELQYDGSNNSNTALCQQYYMVGANSKMGYLVAPPMFNTEGAVYTKYDMRKVQNIWGANKDAENYAIRKFTAEQADGNSSVSDPTTQAPVSKYNRAYGKFSQNYILYRMTDVMLMKAEALVQLATIEGVTTGNKGYNDPNLQEAWNIVYAINKRSIHTAYQNVNNLLKISDYKEKDKLETLVLQERLRELCFEGKRWYDLMRYNYRHVEGVNINALLADCAQVPNYREMLALVTQSSPSPEAIIAKLPTEPYLYLPINQSEMEINKSLKANPAYGSTKDYDRLK